MGSLAKGLFWSCAILTEASFVHHQNYIDENPVRAGLGAFGGRISVLFNLLEEAKNSG